MIDYLNPPRAYWALFEALHEWRRLQPRELGTRPSMPVNLAHAFDAVFIEEGEVLAARRRDLVDAARAWRRCLASSVRLGHGNAKVYGVVKALDAFDEVDREGWGDRDSGECLVDDFPDVEVDEAGVKRAMPRTPDAGLGWRKAEGWGDRDTATLDPVSGEWRVRDVTTGGEKGQKLKRTDLLPADALLAVAEHFGRGAQKYEDRNWEQGYAWSLSYAALLRHLFAWEMGEDIDVETGSLHLQAAGFHVLALLAFELRAIGTDDRPKS